jgi:hypothetical protein
MNSLMYRAWQADVSEYGCTVQVRVPQWFMVRREIARMVRRLRRWCNSGVMERARARRERAARARFVELVRLGGTVEGGRGGGRFRAAGACQQYSSAHGHLWTKGVL